MPGHCGERPQPLLIEGSLKSIKTNKMKAINSEKIKKACDKAMMHYTLAYVRLKRIPIIIGMMLIFCSVNAQNFERYNSLGLTANELIVKMQTLKIGRLMYDGIAVESDTLKIYRDRDFGTLAFYFKNEKCYKQEIIANYSNSYLLKDYYTFIDVKKTVLKTEFNFTLRFEK